MTSQPVQTLADPRFAMPNRLAHETSPYLLQHAENPVDWYPWGPEAKTRAVATGRPILLSIGYSSCHWCHVMERESFEDPGVAALMNETFVNVKVDREERPDVDQVYMRAVQAMTGQGGWPLTVFLTPEGDPFYGGTYFPPQPRHGIPSFRQVLEAAGRAYRERPGDVRRGAAELLSALASGDPRGQAGPEGDAEPGTALLDESVRFLERQYDPAHGGFGRAPKFPQPSTLEILLRQNVRTGDPRSLQMAVHTLRRMAAGGIRDHLGGGFHRYSVDARWLVPHFEKMLYDNALLAQAYLDAFRITGDVELREVATDTLGYILSDLRGPDGGFFSARDADSEGEEGRFYVWTAEEVAAALPEDDARTFMHTYDVTPGGNFEGRNILWLPHDPEAVAREEGLEPGESRDRLARARAVLLEVRARREAPFRDEKVLVNWNGLALRALAEAGGALDRPDYLDAARRGSAFILAALRPDGRLLHTYKDGVAKIPGFLDDHAALGNALLSLHESTLEPRWLEEARWCCDEILSRFWSEEEGLLHDTAHDAETLFVRPRDVMDNAIPSGNSLAAELMLRAGHLFDVERYRDAARRILAREAALVQRYPSAFGRLLAAVDRLYSPPLEVALVGDPAAPETRSLLTTVLSSFHPNRTVTGRHPDGDEGAVPLLADRPPVGGKPTAYVCRGYSCRAPVTDVVALKAALSETSR
ncbi:MAG TPA: thioredoxin domain-containing protein [Longimicrobiales bacterium]|nr:thioredoxin domain-containing protein [Longimicrobiales bacterium]